tara:strand:+ start:210058 stop:210381 length:324 start_codon:yes stop_codon:yes gene_type:complete
MHLARSPRHHLAHPPTPQEPMPQLLKELSIDLWIERDNCTGLSTGGNNTRKLEFLMAEGSAGQIDLAPERTNSRASSWCSSIFAALSGCSATTSPSTTRIAGGTSEP